MKAYVFIAVVIVGFCAAKGPNDPLQRVKRNPANCPDWQKFGPTGPPSSCAPASDPNNRPKTPLEDWFTKEIFDDLFPKANIGWGPNSCWPYNYESFIMAARYFPRFGTEAPDNGYGAQENNKRDLAAFFAHAVQETGENDANLYRVMPSKEKADDCFYRGGFFNWFEGGPISSFMDQASPGYRPEDGEKCNLGGTYWAKSKELNYWYKCNEAKSGSYFKGCYFGRGAIQISYNYNYGQFNNWLKSVGINVDLLKEPNLVMTKRDPPLAVMASLWFYMTPQPPKPAMHDIVMGNWHSGDKNAAVGYKGPIFGPTSLIINNECNGEDPTEPGGGGESRRIKAFKWFCKYFKVPVGDEKTLSCKDMPEKLESIKHNLSYQPNWSQTWKSEPCQCAPAGYGGMIPYFQKDYYPKVFQDLNPVNYEKCVKSVYDNPAMYSLDTSTTECLKFPNKGETTKATEGTTKGTTKSTKGTTKGTTKSTKGTTKGTTKSTKGTTKSTKGTTKGTEATTKATTKSGKFKCSKDGFFPNPTDCTKFYRCVHGTAHKYSCPGGLNFDPSKDVCVWPSQYKC